MTNPHLLRVAARELGVPSSWLRAEAEKGAIPCLQAGKQLLFDISLVRRILLERARSETIKSTESSSADLKEERN